MELIELPRVRLCERTLTVYPGSESGFGQYLPFSNLYWNIVCQAHHSRTLVKFQVLHWLFHDIRVQRTFYPIIATC